MEASKQVLFRLENQMYGIDSMKVMFIEPFEKVMPFAGAAEAIEGIVNLRENVYPICSLRRCFLLEETGGPSQIIFADVHGKTLGLHVDSIVGITDTDDSHMNAVPTILQNGHTDYVDGIIKLNDDLVTLIAPDRLLSDLEWTKLCAQLGDIEARRQAEREEAELRKQEEARRERERLEKELQTNT